MITCYMLRIRISGRLPVPLAATLVQAPHVFQPGGGVCERAAPPLRHLPVDAWVAEHVTRRGHQRWVGAAAAAQWAQCRVRRQFQAPCGRRHQWQPWRRRGWGQRLLLPQLLLR